MPRRYGRTRAHDALSLPDSTARGSCTSPINCRLVRAHDWKARLIRSAIDVQDIFHARHEGGIRNLWNAPVFLLERRLPCIRTPNAPRAIFALDSEPRSETTEQFDSALSGAIATTIPVLLGSPIATVISRHFCTPMSKLGNSHTARTVTDLCATPPEILTQPSMLRGEAV